MFFSKVGKLSVLALPLWASRASNMLIAVIGFWMLAKIGEQPFAASAIAFNVYAFILNVMVGICFAISIKIGVAFGAKETSSVVGEYFSSGITLSMLLAIPAIIVVVAIALALPYLGQKPEIVYGQ